MRRLKNKLYVFPTDIGIGLLLVDRKSSEDVGAFGDVLLEPGVIVNGSLVDPNLFYHRLKEWLKENRARVRHVHFIIDEQNVLIRELRINKADIQKSGISGYLEDQKGKSLHFPFANAVIDHHVVDEDENTIRIVAIITNADILHDYQDVFERLGARNTTYDLPSLAIMREYRGKSGHLPECLMNVMIFDRIVSIQVIENSLPVFAMIEECEGLERTARQKLEEYVERIANYYRFNMRKGKMMVKQVVFVNLSTMISDQAMDKITENVLSGFETVVVRSRDAAFEAEEPGKLARVALASSVKRQQDQMEPAFSLERLKRSRGIANYLFVLAAAVFAIVSLIWLPYHLMQEDIAIQENINLALSEELEALMSSTGDSQDYTENQVEYNEIYAYLVSECQVPTTYLTDLFGLIGPSLEIKSYSVDQKSQEITLIIESTSEMKLYAYLLDIYENYGIIDGVDDPERWMSGIPERRFLSDYTLEVKVVYA